MHVNDVIAAFVLLAAATFPHVATARASAPSFCGELGGDWDGQYCHTTVTSERNAVRDIKVALPGELIDNPTTSAVVRDYLHTLVNNWRNANAHMVADSYGEENYEIFRHGSLLSAVFHEDYHADGPQPNNAYRTFTFDMASGRRLLLSDLTTSDSVDRDPATGPALHRNRAQSGAATARSGNLPVRRRPLDPRQGVLRRVQGVGTDSRRIDPLHARLPGGSRRTAQLSRRESCSGTWTAAPCRHTSRSRRSPRSCVPGSAELG